MADLNLQTRRPETDNAAYDPTFTDRVIAATGRKANPRLAQIMPSLLRHLHDFAREVDLTVAEWAVGVELINEAGRMSDSKRNETQLLCDILGLESLVDEITSKILLNSNPSNATATPSAVQGPFYRTNAPVLPDGSSIVFSGSSSAFLQAASPLLTRISGQIVSASTGKPIPNAIVDVWQAGPNGMYEQQDEEQQDMNLRGRFRTDAEGRYAMVCLRPTEYPIPFDGPAGRLLQLLDRHPYRPAHIHFIVGADGFRTLTTQVFDRENRYVQDDAVFAVKNELLVEFKKVDGEGGGEEEGEGIGGERPKWKLEYDFTLAEI